jgi:hypothetical protein
MPTLPLACIVASSGKASQEIVDTLQAIAGWATAAGAMVQAISTDGDSTYLQLIASMFALLVDPRNFDLDAAMSNQPALRARFDTILMVPDALHLLKILRYNFSKYGKIHAWSGESWCKVTDLVAAGVASHLLSDRSAAKQDDHLSRKVFSAANLKACRQYVEKCDEEARSMQVRADRARDDFGLKRGEYETWKDWQDLADAASKTHRRAVSAYWLLACGVCLQQAIANQGLAEVDRCNLVTYVLAYAVLLNFEQGSSEPAARVPQRRKKVKNCHVWGLSRETITKLVVLCFSLAQFLFTGDAVRASALGTINQEHFHGALRRMSHGDNRGSALCGNLPKAMLNSIVRGTLKIAPEGGASRGRDQQGLAHFHGMPEDAGSPKSLRYVFLGVLSALADSGMRVSGSVLEQLVTAGLLPDWAGVPGIQPEDDVLMRTELRRFLPPPLYVDNLVELPVGPPKWWVTTSDSRIVATSGMAKMRVWASGQQIGAAGLV